LLPERQVLHSEFGAALEDLSEDWMVTTCSAPFEAALLSHPTMGVGLT
jgi:hypothetical protein